MHEDHADQQGNDGDHHDFVLGEKAFNTNVTTTYSDDDDNQ